MVEHEGKQAHHPLAATIGGHFQNALDTHQTAVSPDVSGLSNGQDRQIGAVHDTTLANNDLRRRRRAMRHTARSPLAGLLGSIDYARQFQVGPQRLISVGNWDWSTNP